MNYHTTNTRTSVDCFFSSFGGGFGPGCRFGGICDKRLVSKWAAGREKIEKKKNELNFSL